MQKKTIAIIFGGNSTEYEVSLQSVTSVFENIDLNKFDKTLFKSIFDLRKVKLFQISLEVLLKLLL